MTPREKEELANTNPAEYAQWEEDQAAWEQEQAAQAADHQAAIEAAEAAWYSYVAYLEENNITELPLPE